MEAKETGTAAPASSTDAIEAKSSTERSREEEQEPKRLRAMTTVRHHPLGACKRRSSSTGVGGLGNQFLVGTAVDDIMRTGDWMTRSLSATLELPLNS